MKIARKSSIKFQLMRENFIIIPHLIIIKILIKVKCLTAPQKIYTKGARKLSPILYIYDKSACEQLSGFSMETRIAQLLEG